MARGQRLMTSCRGSPTIPSGACNSARTAAAISSSMAATQWGCELESTDNQQKMEEAVKRWLRAKIKELETERAAHPELVIERPWVH